MVDEITISDLDPIEDNFTLSDLFTDEEDIVTDLGDGIESTTMSEPQGLMEGILATGVDILRDYRNTALATGEGISMFMPVGNYFLPEMFRSMMYEDPEGDVLFPNESMYGTNWAREIGNYIYPPSEVHEDNPYKDTFSNIRLGANVIPAAIGALGSRGTFGLPFLMKHLNPKIQKLIAQALPKTSGQGKFFNKNFFREPNTMRNIIFSQATNPNIIRDSMTAEAAPNSFGIHDRDYAVFDEYITPRLEALRNRPTERPPSNRQPGLDNYRGR